MGDLAGLRVIHLQCHFGADTLALAQRGAEVVGVDFSAAAVSAARELAAELGFGERACFVECNLYDAPNAVGEAGAFDLASKRSAWRAQAALERSPSSAAAVGTSALTSSVIFRIPTCLPSRITQ